MNNLNNKKFSFFNFITGSMIIISLLYIGVRLAVSHALESTTATVIVKEHLYECEGIK